MIMKRLAVFCFVVLSFAFSLQMLAVPDADLQVGCVNVDGLRLRLTPSLSGQILTNAYEGDFVVVYSETVTVDDGCWYKVVFNGNEGYMSVKYVDLVGDADFNVGLGVITGNSVNFRSKPSTDSEVINSYSKGKVVSVLGIEDGWFKAMVDSSAGYIHPNYVSFQNEDVLDVPVKKISSSTSDNPTPVSVSSSGLSLQTKVIDYAATFLGCKYKYGTMNGTTFDCSGFTTYVFKHFGISLNRSAAGQLSNGTSVAKADLQPGDLVLFRDPSRTKSAASHVGIYVGNNKFIHASSGAGVVKYNHLTDSYYAKYYIGARRVIS